MSAVAGKCLRKKYLIQRLINQFGLIFDPVPWNYDSWHWNKLLKFSDFIHDGFSRQFNLIITTCLTSLLQAFIDWKYQNKMNLYYLQKQFVKRFLFSDDFSEEKQVCNWHLWLWLCRLGLMKMQMKQLTLFYSISRTKFSPSLICCILWFNDCKHEFIRFSQFNALKATVKIMFSMNKKVFCWWFTCED